MNKTSAAGFGRHPLDIDSLAALIGTFNASLYPKTDEQTRVGSAARAVALGGIGGAGAGAAMLLPSLLGGRPTRRVLGELAEGVWEVGFLPGLVGGVPVALARIVQPSNEAGQQSQVNKQSQFWSEQLVKRSARPEGEAFLGFGTSGQRKRTLGTMAGLSVLGLGGLGYGMHRAGKQGVEELDRARNLWRSMANSEARNARMDAIGEKGMEVAEQTARRADVPEAPLNSNVVELDVFRQLREAQNNPDQLRPILNNKDISWEF